MGQRRDLQHPRRSGGAAAAAVALCLLAVLVVRSEGRDIRPSEHGLPYARDPGPASPAMAAFFHGRPGAALPEASDVSDSSWSLAPPAPLRSIGRDRPRAALLAAGVVCGVLGLALVVAVAVAYVAHVRRSRPEVRTGSHLSLVRRSEQ